MTIPQFDVKREKVLSIFRKKSGYLTEQQLLRELGNLFIYGEMKVILKHLLKSDEVVTKKVGDKDFFTHRANQKAQN